MTDLQLFKFEHQPVRIVLVDGEPWFVLSDLCRALGISNVGNAAARLDDDVKGVCQNCDAVRCMGCVCRDPDHDCVDDCPKCGWARTREAVAAAAVEALEVVADTIGVSRNPSPHGGFCSTCLTLVEEKQELREKLADYRTVLHEHLGAVRQAYRQIQKFLDGGDRECLIVAQAILDPVGELDEYRGQ
mgnify:CR=1 FL=1